MEKKLIVFYELSQIAEQKRTKYMQAYVEYDQELEILAHTKQQTA